MGKNYEDFLTELNVDWNNCKAEPDFTLYDGLELDGCADFIGEDGQKYTECRQGEAAEYLTLYGHCRELGGVAALHDFPIETDISEILLFCDLLIKQNPCLSEFGMFVAL